MNILTTSITRRLTHAATRLAAPSRSRDRHDDGSHTDPDAGFTLMETLVSVLVLGLTMLGTAQVVIMSTRLNTTQAARNSARQITQDALGYLVSAPVNVLYGIANPAHGTVTGDSGIVAAPASLPGSASTSLASTYASTVQVYNADYANPAYLTATGQHATPEGSVLSGTDLEVVVRTTYRTKASPAPVAVSGFIVRSGIDTTQTPPSSIPVSTVPCDGTLSTDNLCAPLLTSSLAADQSAAILSVTGPTTGTSGPPSYTVQRSAAAAFTAPVGVPAVITSDPAHPAVTDSTLAAGAAVYYYRVRYSTSAFTSAWSSTVSEFTAPAPTVKIATTPGNPNSITISLTTPPPAAGVSQVFQKSTDPSFATAVTTLPGTTDPETLAATTTALYYRALYTDTATGHSVTSATVAYTLPIARP